MKNTLIDLNDHLFKRLEKLNDDDVKGDELLEEINRAKAMSGMAENIIHASEVLLRGALSVANSLAEVQTPPTLEYRPKNKKMLPLEQ